MRIHWIRAQAPRRVLALARYLGVEVDYVEEDLRAGALKAPAYLALNPNGKAPLLVDGDTVLWESSAIMAYLCVQAGSDLWPAHDPLAQIELLRWLSWNDQHWAPAVAPFYFEHVVKSTFGFGPPDRDALADAPPDFLRYAQVLDAHLAGRQHVALQRLTIADFQLASMAAYWRESEMPMSGFGNIVRWLDGLMQIPAWAEPWPA